MCKGNDKSIAIGQISLLYKEGGKSGVYRRDAVVGHDLVLN
jgi:cyclic pyranopterin phosphate synthase